MPSCFSDALPLRAVRHIGHLDALCLQLVADAVGLGEVLRLLGVCALTDQRLDGLVRRAVLGDDGERTRVCAAAAAFFSRSAAALAMRSRLRDLVEVGDDRELGRAARLGLEHIVEHGDAHGGVEVVVHLLGEFRAVLGAHGLVHAAPRPEIGDLRKELVVGEHGVIQILPGEHEALAVVALQAEEAVGQRVVALLLKQGNGQKFALDLLILPSVVLRWATWHQWGTKDVRGSFRTGRSRSCGAGRHCPRRRSAGRGIRRCTSWRCQSTRCASRDSRRPRANPT